MTGLEAQRILRKPIFGCQTCLDAIKVLSIAEELRQARQWANAYGISEKNTKPEKAAEVDHEAAEAEIGLWQELGYRSAR
jgi:hypothetical protein